jgi:hypothetical protein
VKKFYNLFKKMLPAAAATIFFVFGAINTANAQCTDITLTATSTVATCYSNGTITVTIGGSSINDLSLADAQLMITPDGSGTSTGWLTWPDLGNVKTYTGVIGDAYTVAFRALCSDLSTVERSVRVIVGTTFSTMTFNCNASKQSMNCKPTGEITVNFTGGTPPYVIDITPPPAYTGPTTFTTSSPTFYLYNLPSGSYTIAPHDQCGNYPPPQNRNVMQMGSDLPYASTSVVPVSGSCTEVKLKAQFSTDFPMEFEYAFVENASDPKVWKPCNKSNYDFDINVSGSYATFCASPYDLGIFSLRVKDCPTITQDITFSTSSLCNVYISLATVDVVGSCTNAKLWISVPGAVCYPLSWSIALASDPGTSLESGSILNSSGVTATNNYTRGTTYVVTIQESGPNGRTWTQNWTPTTAAGQTFVGSPVSQLEYDENCGATFGNRAISIYPTGFGATFINDGSVITYLSGPDNYELPMGVPGSSYAIPNGYFGTRFYLTDPLNTTYADGKQKLPLPKGDYSFMVKNICGFFSYPVINVYDLEAEQFTYTLTKTCDGYQFIPIGRIKRVYSSSSSYGDTYYRVLSSPDNGYYSMITWSSGSSSPTGGSGYSAGAFMFTVPGTYTISMVHSTASYACPYETVTFYYEGTLASNPPSYSAYMCAGQSVGNIHVQSKGGTPPFEYSIVASGTTSPVLAFNNTDGKFNFGTLGATYDIIVKDGCGAQITINNVTLLDLQTAAIISVPNNGFFCENEEIQINSAGLGQVTYEWYKLPNLVTPVSTEQNPSFPAIYTGSVETYQLRVTPEGCAAQKTENVNIKVNAAPTAPTSISSSAGITVCPGTPITLTAIGGDGGEDGAGFEWGTAICGNIYSMLPSTANYINIIAPNGGSTSTYWVHRKGTGACNGTVTDCATITITTINASSASMITIDEPATICNNTGTTLTAYAEPPYSYSPALEGNLVFRWYADPYTSTPLYTGNPFPTGNLAETTTFWVSVECDNYCEGAANTNGRKPVTVKAERCGYEIWNWADLAYLNVLIQGYGSSPTTCEWATKYQMKAVLMQDLGVPGQTGTFGTGTPTVQNGEIDCPYFGDRRNGWYGYHNCATTGVYNATIPATSYTLQVGGTGLTGQYNYDPALTNVGWDATGWRKIGINPTNHRFVGEFDGQGFEINGLWMNSANYYLGLFGYLGVSSGAVVSNIANLGVNIYGGTSNALKGSAYIGGLAGNVNYSTISKCYTTGLVEGESVSFGYVGGLLGYVQTSSKVSDCYSTCDVSTTDRNAGGLVGYFMGSDTIHRCYATGAVSSLNFSGGLIGQISFTARITNSYAFNCSISATENTLGRISAPTDPACFINNRANANMKLNGNLITNGTLTNSNGLNITYPNATNHASADMAALLTSGAWDTKPYSGNVAGPLANLPVLKDFLEAKQEPEIKTCTSPIYEIWNWADLAYINILIENQVNNTVVQEDQKITYYEKFILMQDLGIPGQPETYGHGDQDNSGIGKGHTSTLKPCPYIGDADADRKYGFYGYENWKNSGAYGANLAVPLKAGGDNITELDMFYSGTNFCWNADGWMPIGKITQISPYSFHFVGKFDGQGFEITGLWIDRTEQNQGLFGYAQDAKIINLGVNITGGTKDFVKGKDNVGGFVGHIGNGEIANCYTTGKVIGHANVGGFAGKAQRQDNPASTIYSCYSTCQVTGEHFVGGFVGDANDYTIRNCFATGEVFGELVPGGAGDDAHGLDGFYGGFVGASNANIFDCYATGDVSSINATVGWAGGFAGIITYPMHHNYATGNITAVNCAGGFAGQLNDPLGTGALGNCFAFGCSVTTNGPVVGRIVGDYMQGILNNNYANDKMTLNGAPASGGLHDNKNGADIDYATATNHTSGPIFNAFFDDDQDNLKWIPNPYNPNYTFNTYNVDANTNLPILRAFDDENFPSAIQTPEITQCTSKTYQIWNWADLAYINVLIDNEANNLNVLPDQKVSYYEKFVLMQNLGMPNGDPDVCGGYGTGIATLQNGGVTCPYENDSYRRYGYYGYENYINTSGTTATTFWVGGESYPFATFDITTGNYNWDMQNMQGWVPIGASSQFKGEFDGQGFEISGLWIDRPTEDYQGLFGWIIDSYIKDLGVNISIKEINGKNFVGGLVGRFASMNATYFGDFSNCYVTGNVNGVNSVGGLVGDCGIADITNCYATGNVTGTEAMIGGLVGAASGTIMEHKITNCYATGNVIAANAMNVGGLVGESGYEVKNCYATGNVIGKDNVGGLVGLLVGNITNCFAFGCKVETVIQPGTIGRVFGNATQGDTYTNNYANDKMTLNGAHASGGLHDNKDGADIDYATATTHDSGPIFNAFFDDDDDMLVWIPSPYNPNYNYDREYNVGANTNLPILRAFYDEEFPCALQEPEIKKCCEIVINPKPDAAICSGIMPTIDDLITSVEVDGTVLTGNDEYGTLTFYYYEDADGDYPTSLSGFDFTAGPIYIKVTNGDCESNIVPVNLLVNTTPNAPSVTTTQKFCYGKTVADLMPKGDEFKWYNDPDATTETPKSTKLEYGETYYATITSPEGCESAKSNGVTVETQTPAPNLAPDVSATFCGSATVLDLISLFLETNINIYETAAGGTPMDFYDEIEDGVTYYVTQTDGGCESMERFSVKVTINSIPPAPSVTTPQVFCYGDTVGDLQPQGDNITWYNGSSDAADVVEKNTLLENGATYYATLTEDGCESAKSTNGVTVTSRVFAPEIAEGNNKFCGSATVADLIAKIIGIGIKIYATPTGNTPMDGTDNLENGKTYYASQINADDCESLARLSIPVTIYSLPPAPSVTTPQPFCFGKTVADLIPQGDHITWYNSNSDGATVVLKTTPLTNNAMYYATITDANGCESGKSTVVTVSSNEPEPNFISGEDATFCGSATVAQLIARLTGSNIKLYTSATDDTPMNGTDYLTDGETYFASQTITDNEGDDCESLARLVIQVTINQIPSAITITTPQAFCFGATVADLIPPGDEITWYNGSTDAADEVPKTTPLENGATYYATYTEDGCESAKSNGVTVNAKLEPPTGNKDQGFCGSATVLDLINRLSGSNIKIYDSNNPLTPLDHTEALANGTYYASQSDGSGCASMVRLAVDVTIYPIPPAPTVTSPQNFCVGATINDLIPQGSDINWFNDPDGVTPYLKNNPLVNGATYYATITDNGCTSAKSTGVTVTVDPKDITVEIKTVCTGDEIEYTAIPINSGTYEWKVNDITVQSGSSAYFTLHNPVVGDLVEVELTSNSPCATSSTATDSKIVTLMTAADETPATVPSPIGLPAPLEPLLDVDVRNFRYESSIGTDGALAFELHIKAGAGYTPGGDPDGRCYAANLLYNLFLEDGVEIIDADPMHPTPMTPAPTIIFGDKIDDVSFAQWPITLLYESVPNYEVKCVHFDISCSASTNPLNDFNNTYTHTIDAVIYLKSGSAVPTAKTFLRQKPYVNHEPYPMPPSNPIYTEFDRTGWSAQSGALGAFSTPPSDFHLLSDPECCFYIAPNFSGITTTYCQGETAATLPTKVDGITGYWVDDTGTEIYQVSTTTATTIPDVYTFVLNPSEQCVDPSASLTISVTINESPAIPKLKDLSVDEITICAGEDIRVNDILSLIENEGLIYTVYTDADACTEPYTDGDITADIAIGSYTFYVVATGTNGCSSACKGLEITVNAKACVKLDLKVFLEGVVQPPLSGKTMDGEPLPGNWMTAHIQDPDYLLHSFGFELPVENPYYAECGVLGDYTDINNPLGPAGEVVDWILVEIWGNVDAGTFKYDLVERQALLLKPDGSIRDTKNQIPQFMTYADSEVQIVVRHRNHLPVMSNDLVNINPISSITIPYDFSDINHVYNPWASMPTGMRHGAVCLWAGDINMDGIIDSGDSGGFITDINAMPWGQYRRSDLNMDGFIDSGDSGFIITNIKAMRYSPYMIFTPRTP